METSSPGPAPHGVDLPAAAAYLAQRDRPAEELKPLFYQGEGALLLVLSHLAERLPRARTRAELESLAGLLPRALEGLGPEAQRVLAGLYRSLAPWLVFPELPDWRAQGLLPVVAVAWLRTELLVHPALLARCPADEALFQALAGLSVGDLPRPRELIQQLCRHPDGRVSLLGVDLALGALGEGVLPATEVVALLRERLGAASAELSTGTDAVIVRALAALGEPWAQVASPEAPPLASLLSRGDAVKRAVLAAAARWRLDGPLRAVLGDREAPPELRQEALRRLGEFAGREAIEVALLQAAEDPVLLGAPLVEFLRGLHLRGHFVGGEHLDLLLGVFLEHHALSADEIVSLTFPCRQALIAWLDEIPADDRRWHHLAALVVALEHGASGRALPRPPAALLLDRLLEVQDLSLRRAFIVALGQAHHEPAEAAILGQLEAEPAACLQALRSIGGEATAEALAIRLGLDQPGGTITPALRHDRLAALVLLWKLRAGDPARRRETLGRLDPRRIPRDIAADLGRSVDPLERQILLQNAAEHTSSGLLALIAAQGDAGAVPIVAELLLRLVRDLHDEELVNTGNVTEKRSRVFHDLRRSEETASIGPDVQRAVRQLGRTLHQRGEIRPRCLLDARDPDDAGERLLADLALSVLDRDGLQPEEQAIVLRLLASVNAPTIRPRVYRLIRSRHPAVRKAAIACLAQRGAADLAINLAKLVHAGDIQTIRQSLLALAGLGATWASDVVAACLEHRTMNIKKTAAEALRSAGSASAVPRLLFWLGRHDNPGFRAEIIASLRPLLGPGYRATMLAALDAQTEPRGQSLMIEALDGALSPTAVRALVQREARGAPALLLALQRGEISLGSGSLSDLSRELDRHGLLPAAGSPAGGSAGSSLRPAVRQLAARGWDPEVAAGLLADLQGEPLSPAERWAVRRFLTEWVTLAAEGDPGLREPALGVILGLASPPQDADRPLLARHLEAWLAHLAGSSGATRSRLIALLTGLLPSLTPPERLRIVQSIRVLPAEPNLEGWSPFALLRQAGAIVRREDIEQAIAGARGTSNPVELMIRLLGEAFGATAAGGKTPLGDELTAALGGDLLAVARRWQHTKGSRAVLAALIRLFPRAPEAARPALLDALCALQPPGAAPWVLAEATLPASPPLPRATDLHAPPSAALRARLLAQLDSQEPRDRHDAARQLAIYQDDEVQDALLRCYLDGNHGIPPGAALARRLIDQPGLDLPRWLRASPPQLHRVLRLLALLDRPRQLPLVPLLLPLWERSQGETASLLAQMLAGVGNDTLALEIFPRLAGGQWGYLDLIHGHLLRVPEVAPVLARAEEDGRSEVGKRLHLDAGEWQATANLSLPALGELVSQLGYRPRPRPSLPAITPDQDRDDPPPTPQAELLAAARGSDAEKARAALTELARTPTDATIALLVELVGHRNPRVRLHAHRLLRNVADRPTYLTASATLLDDPQPSICVSAIRTVTHGHHLPALPRLIELLSEKTATIQRAAADGLVLLGADSVGPLRRALAHTRPDRRAPLARVLERIEAEQARQQAIG
jgi:hypothetical protein